MHNSLVIDTSARKICIIFFFIIELTILAIKENKFSTIGDLLLICRYICVYNIKSNQNFFCYLKKILIYNIKL